MKIVLPRQLAEAEVEQIGAYPVPRTSHLDGSKFYLENDNWLLLRFSGTESLLRIFAEADTQKKAWELVEWGKELVQLESFEG
jgi:phosphomannomutase